MDLDFSLDSNYSNLLSRLRDFAVHLSENHWHLSQEDKLMMKDFLLVLVRSFVNYTKQLNPIVVPLYLRDDLATLESHLEFWLTKGGQYPKHFNSDFVLRVCHLETLRQRHYDSHTLRQGPISIERLEGKLLSFGEPLFSRVSDTILKKTVVSVTKNFEILQGQGLYFRVRSKDYERRLESKITAVIYERDLVVVQKDQHYDILHLEKAPEHSQFTSSDLKDCNMLRQFTCFQSGIVVTTCKDSNLELRYVPGTLLGPRNEVKLDE